MIGYDKLKRHYKQFTDRRKLVKDYDAFIADLRIYKMLPEVLGKEFYSKKKYPCPVKLHGYEKSSELEAVLNKCAESTFFSLGNGPNYSVKVGRTFQNSKDIAKNCLSALGQALAYATVHDEIDFTKVSQVTLRLG